MDPEVILGGRGNPLLVVNKFKLFNSYKSKENIVTWRCIKKSCTGKVQTIGESVDFVENSLPNMVHNHEPDQEVDIIRRRLTNFCKRKAKEEFLEKPGKIIASELAKYIHESSNGAMTKNDVNLIRNSMYRTRISHLSRISKSRSLVQEGLAAMIILTNIEENFVFVNDASNGVLIFSTSINLNYLKTLDTVYFDGTLNYCVKHFAQLYFLYGIVNGTCIPLVYALLGDKRFCTCEVFLKNLVEVGIKPAIIYIDFQSTMHEAIRSVLPETTLKGFRFYLSQIWFRKIQEVELEAELGKPEEEVGKFLTFILYGLPFLKSEAVVDFFAQFFGAIKPNDTRVNNLWEYIVEDYIDKNSKFPPSFWATDNPDIHSVINVCEAFHSEVNQRFDESPPDIHKFIAVLQQMQISTYMKIEDADRNIILLKADKDSKKVYHIKL